MRKVILQLAVSLDNFIEGPNGEYDWCFTDQDYGFTQFLQSTDAVFFGRKSYELFAGYTPGDDASELEKHMSDVMAEKKKYVFSTTLPPSNNFTLIGNLVAEEVLQLKRQPGKHIWLYGGASLVTTFMREKLVDELLLAVHPILLGGGKPLFQHLPSRIQLQLLESTPYESGLVMLRYKVL